MSVQLNHAHRSNGTEMFSVCIEIVRVSRLRHRKTEVLSCSLLAPTVQNCMVRQRKSYANLVSTQTVNNHGEKSNKQ